ncbi:MAG: hypothetical protein ACLQOO_17810 [Terriglobia bacterium]
MSENWYGDRFKGNFLTDTLLPFAFGCIPVATIIFGLIMWLKACR